jgi:hypothetical protein
MRGRRGERARAAQGIRQSPKSDGLLLACDGPHRIDADHGRAYRIEEKLAADFAGLDEIAQVDGLLRG